MKSFNNNIVPISSRTIWNMKMTPKIKSEYCRDLFNVFDKKMMENNLNVSSNTIHFRMFRGKDKWLVTKEMLIQMTNDEEIHNNKKKIWQQINKIIKW